MEERQSAASSLDRPARNQLAAIGQVSSAPNSEGDGWPRLIDCLLGILTLNALAACDRLTNLPIQCEYYALEGVTQLSRTVNLVTGTLIINRISGIP